VVGIVNLVDELGGGGHFGVGRWEVEDGKWEMDFYIWRYRLVLDTILVLRYNWKYKFYVFKLKCKSVLLKIL